MIQRPLQALNVLDFDEAFDTMPAEHLIPNFANIRRLLDYSNLKIMLAIIRSIWLAYLLQHVAAFQSQETFNFTIFFIPSNLFTWILQI